MQNTAVSAAPPTSPAHRPAETAALGCEQPERMLFFVFSENSWSNGNVFEVITSRSHLVAGRALE